MQANATNGSKRQVRNQQIDTAEIVNQAIEMINESGIDLDAARDSLRMMGHTAPADEMIKNYATQTAVLAAIEKLTGANATGQLGKWDFSSAQTIHDSFNSYLSRRVQGQRAEYTRKYRR